MFFYNESDSEVSQVVPAPSDPYFYNTSLLLKMDSDFSDSSVHQHTTATGGNVAVSNSEFKYDGGSGYFDGNGDYLTVGTSADCDTGGVFAMSEQFTVEMWINFSNVNGEQQIIENYNGASGPGWTIFKAGDSRGIALYVAGAGSINTGVQPQANTWHHLSFCRDGTNGYIFLDGNLIGSLASFGTSEYFQNQQPLHIARRNPADGRDFWANAYIDDVRITKGVARYTANFTPPDSHPTIGPSEIVSTGMVLELDAEDYETVGYNGGTKTSGGNDPIYVGTDEKYFQFNGAGHISWPSNSDYGPGTGDFTVESWTKGSMERLVQSDNTIDSSGNNIWWVGSSPTWGMMFNLHGPGSRGFRGGAGHDFDNWTHTVMVRKQGNNAVYINGQKQTLSHNNIDGQSVGQSGVIVGAGTANAFTTGQVAAVRLFNRSLTEAEALQNFEATKSRFGL